MPHKKFETHTCETCVYFKRYLGDFAEKGECRKNPPVTHQFGDGDDVMTVFPEISETDYCGEWTPITLVSHVRAIHNKDNRVHWNENVLLEDRGNPKSPDDDNDDHEYTDRVYTPPKNKEGDDDIPF